MRKILLVLIGFTLFLFSCVSTVPSPHPQRNQSPPGMVKSQQTEKKLEQLKEMKAKGLITEEEYKIKKKEILEKL